jgi:hypothetical protein
MLAASLHLIVLEVLECLYLSDAHARETVHVLLYEARVFFFDEYHQLQKVATSLGAMSNVSLCTCEIWM